MKRKVLKQPKGATEAGLFPPLDSTPGPLNHCSVERQMAGVFQEFCSWTGLPISMELINLIRFWQLLEDHIGEEGSVFACPTI